MRPGEFTVTNSTGTFRFFPIRFATSTSMPAGWLFASSIP
jgi:hypothetical protein